MKTYPSIIAGIAMGVMILTLAACLDRETAKPQKAAHAEDNQGAKRVMAQKLVYAQMLLGGIAREDFDTVRSSADALLALSREADWQVRQTLTYNLLSTEFRRIARDLSEHAVDKDLDSIFTNYVQLTQTCIECHKHMRTPDGALKAEDVTPVRFDLDRLP